MASETEGWGQINGRNSRVNSNALLRIGTVSDREKKLAEKAEPESGLHLKFFVKENLQPTLARFESERR